MELPVSVYIVVLNGLHFYIALFWSFQPLKAL